MQVSNLFNGVLNESVCSRTIEDEADMKVMYHDTFDGNFPGHQQSVDYLQQITNKSSVSIINSINLLSRDIIPIYDANMFTSVMLCLQDGENLNNLPMMRRMFSQRCTGCLKHKHIVTFITHNETLSVRCNECRRELCLTKVPHLLYSRYCFNDCYETLIEVARSHSLHLAASAQMQFPATCQLVIVDELQFLSVHVVKDLGKDVKEVFEANMLQFLYTMEGYKYRSKNSTDKKKNSSRFLCRQATCTTTNRPEMQHRKRHRSSIRTYNCKGVINFSYSGRALVSMSAKHEFQHEPFESPTTLSEDSKSKIREWARR